MVFVVLDGLDASGKSTQALKLCRHLENRGCSVCVRFHPSDDSYVGSETRKYLYCKGKNAHFAAAFFYILDVMRSILLYSWRKYDYMIFVRYLMGTSYLPEPLSIIAYDFFAAIVPKSEFRFFLDITPEEAYRRILRARKKHEMFENLKELELVRKRALYLALRGKWKILSAEKPIEDIGKEILRLLSASSPVS